MSPPDVGLPGSNFPGFPGSPVSGVSGGSPFPERDNTALVEIRSTDSFVLIWVWSGHS